MPKTNTPTDELIMFSVRVPPRVAAWIDEVAELKGSNRSRLSRQVFEDASTFYGLPAPVVEALKRDAESLNIDPTDPRDYVVNLLMMRYSELRASGEPQKRKP